MLPLSLLMGQLYREVWVVEMKGLTLTELLAWRAPFQEYIIANDILLSQGTMGIYGAEGAWKSMMALDLTFRVSMGKDWFGFQTWPSSVYYFQSEIPQTPLQKRAYKYATGNALSSNNCWFCTELYEKIDRGWGYTELEREIARVNPQVLIIDPIYNSISAKLVDDYEVGLFLDRMNMLRSKYKIAIIFIHHNRQEEHAEGQSFHYGTEEWFGSSRFKRWLDTMVYVEVINDGDPLVDLKLTFEKTRHAQNKILPIEIQANRLDLTLKRKVAGGML